MNNWLDKFPIEKAKDGKKLSAKQRSQIQQDDYNTRKPDLGLQPIDPNLLFRIQNTPDQATMRASDPKKGNVGKAANIIRNPMTALKYKAQGQDIPDNLQYADRNRFDNALDIINPMTYLDAAGRTASLKHFREQGLTADAFVKTGLDIGMVAGIGSQFEIGSTKVANPFNKTVANPVEIEKMNQMLANRPAYSSLKERGVFGDAGRSDYWKAIDEQAPKRFDIVSREPIKVPTVKLKGNGYQRIPASGVESGEHLGMVAESGEFKPFMNEPKSVKNSIQFENSIKEAASDYNKAYNEWNANPEKHAFFKPLEPFHGYKLEQLQNTSRVVPGFTYSDNSQQSTPITISNSPYVPLQKLQSKEDNRPISKKSKSTIKRTIEQSTPVTQDTTTAKQASQRREEWLHSHNGEPFVLDSAKNSKKVNGGKIMNKSNWLDDYNVLQAKSGIHIKPENRGKFTEYKKRTGKTTEEALHSKDPHVRKMANFARNAKKWNHAADGESLPNSVPERQISKYVAATPYIDENAINTGMMKGKIATADAMGNPGAHRMVQNYPQQYTFTGREPMPDWVNRPPEGATGTHFMSSTDNFAVPFIQADKTGKLQYKPNASPRDKEAMKFNTEEDANYFGNHYKEVAPMMRNWEMKKGGKVAANGMIMQPVTDQERDQWERVQTAAYQQGYRGNDHNKQMGNDFLKSQGFDPGRLGAIQQDFLNLQGTGKVNAPAGYSPSDQFYGHKTAQQRYRQYQVVEPNGKTTNYGSNAIAASGDVNNFLHPTQQPVQPKQWESNDQGISMDAPQYQPVASTRKQQSNWHTGEDTNYSIDSLRQEEIMNNGGKLKYMFSKGGKIKKKSC